MSTAPQSSRTLQALACLRCKARKTGCDHARPSCSNCIARQLDCVYPDGRKKKRPPTSSAKQTRCRKREGYINGMFERLQRLEEKCSHLAARSSAQIRSQDGRFESPTIIAPPPRQENTPSSPSTASSAGTTPETAEELPSSSSRLARRPRPPLNPSALIKQAFDKVLSLKQQSISDRIACFDVCIRRELAKACIQNFCKHHQLDIFPRFINIKLMHLIPDIIAMPEVSLDPAALVLYYGILHQGSLFTSAELTPQDKNLTQSIYLCCLRALPAWIQQQDRGTETGLITGVLLARIAAEHADFESSWNIHKLACRYVQELSLHRLDADISGALMNAERLSEEANQEANQDRRSLWALALMDLLFRLIHDKPALLTADLNEWRVNLPWLDAGPKQSQPHVPTLVFLIKSRLTFILLRFFDTIGPGAKDEDAVASHVQSLCAEVEQLLQEWSVEHLMKAHEAKNASWWSLNNLMLSGYCSILFMLRKMTAARSASSGVPAMDDDDGPPTPLMISAARQILHLAHQSLRLYPHPATVCNVFGSFRCYVAYGCLARHLSMGDLQGSAEVVASDVALLESVTQDITVVADVDKTLLPIVRALWGINQGIYAAWAGQAGVFF